MFADASRSRSFFAPTLSLLSDNTTAIAKRIAAEFARSKNNIRLWNSYLPGECVSQMIRMGWDRSA
jgi:hypothetical protein